MGCGSGAGTAGRSTPLGYLPLLWGTITLSRGHPIAVHFPTHEQKQALLEKVMRIADQRLAAAAAQEARAFITHYYNNVDAEDLADRAPEDLYGAAMAHLSFARSFSSGTPKLCVYNPRLDEHGWS